MIYKSNDKYYIKVGTYLVEVDIKVDGDNVDIKPLKNKLEINGNINMKAFSLKEIKVEFASKKEVEKTKEKIVIKKENDYDRNEYNMTQNHTFNKNSSKYKM